MTIIHTMTAHFRTSNRSCAPQWVVIANKTRTTTAKNAIKNVPTPITPNTKLLSFNTKSVESSVVSAAVTARKISKENTAFSTFLRIGGIGRRHRLLMTLLLLLKLFTDMWFQLFNLSRTHCVLDTTCTRKEFPRTFYCFALVGKTSFFFGKYFQKNKGKE